MRPSAVPLVFALSTFTHLAAGESNAPTFMGYSPLASSDPSKDANIALNKAVLSGVIRYVGPGPDNANHTDNPENAFDGDDSTSTGKAGNITLDLGDVFVVDRVVVKTAFAPLKYQIYWSAYSGPSKLPPTYDLVTGLGKVPDSENANQEFLGLSWINDAPPVPDRMPAAQPARFLNFSFAAVYVSGGYVNQTVNEIEVYGHPYVPVAGDRMFLSRKDWEPTAYADAAPEGEGQTVTHAIDGQMTQTWQPRTAQAVGQWYQVDLGEEVAFDQIYIVFAIGAAQASAAFELFASNDPANWGTPIANLDYGTSDVKSFPTQKARYIRLETTAAAPGNWNIDELNLLAAVTPEAIGPGTGGSSGLGGGGSGGTAPSTAGATQTSTGGVAAGSAGSPSGAPSMPAGGSTGVIARPQPGPSDSSGCVAAPSGSTNGDSSSPWLVLLGLFGAFRRSRGRALGGS